MGKRALALVEAVGLVVIAVATVIALGQEIMTMVTQKRVTLADLLLLFIYLEVLTMVGLYLTSGQLPVRMPLYIGMVALARYLILDVKEMDAWRMLAVAGAVLLLAAAVLLIRYGHVRFPYGREE
jgi:protein PsiE